VASMPTNTVPISARGFSERSSELELLRARARRGLASADAADDSALQALVEERAELERRIAVLEGQLAVAEIVPPAADGAVGFGSLVRVSDGDGRDLVYELVGPLEADIGSGRVSISAPVGRALFGRRCGDRVDVDAPGGRLTFEITAVVSPAPADWTRREIGSSPHGGPAVHRRP
jgi:transcription elongation factor GreA